MDTRLDKIGHHRQLVDSEHVAAVGDLRELAKYGILMLLTATTDVSGRAVAVLSVQLRATLAEIAELAPLAETSAVDEVLARRAERAAPGEAVAPSHAVARDAKRHS